MQDPVITGDALQVLPTLPQESVALTVFSPPYDQIRDYHAKWDPQTLLDLAAPLLRVTVTGGLCCMVIQDGTRDFAKSLSTFRTAVHWCDVVGWRLFEACIYAKAGRPGAWWNQRFRVDHEYILMFLKGPRHRHFDKEGLKVPATYAGVTFGGSTRLTSGALRPLASSKVPALKCRGTIWPYPTANHERRPGKALHPATMPMGLASDLIRCFSAPCDLVLDPMCGSGTTLVAARDLGRQWLGIEISEEYAALARGALGDLP